MNEPETTLSPEDRLVANALVAGRPAPAPAFRTELSHALAVKDPGYGHRPAHLRARAGLLVAAGLLLGVVGLLVGSGAI